MKIYIVSTGDYSDYSIEKVFSSREKAEKYISFRKNSNEYQIEEFEVNDESDFEQIKCLWASYELDEGKEKFRLHFNSSTTLDTTEKDERCTVYSEYNSKDHKSITIRRVIKSDTYDETFLRNKYQQVCRDLYAKIKSLKDLEGWDTKMIQEWLGNNENDYIPECE